jgi:glycerophosphoryl diester phosphodiesterase
VTGIFAHRGSAGNARENTIGAFVAARELGADGVELDVRRTSDGVLMVHHDASVAELGALASLTARELPDWLPTLGDALDACGGIDVNVEIKNAPCEPGYDEGTTLAIEVARQLERRGETGRMVVSSFDLATVDAVRAYSVDLETAWLVEPGADVAGALALVAEHGHRGVHPYHLFVDVDFVEAARVAGVAVRVWTVDEPDRVAELAAMGVEAIITNDVARSLAALGRSSGTA